MKNDAGFYQSIRNEFTTFVHKQEQTYPAEDTLTIDLHCHDWNSDVPDELLARILNIPETWLPTDELVKSLTRNNCDTITVTNHNNARSCYELRDRGIDVVTGAEFSCTVPDFGIGIHVLTYGFTPNQEEKLKSLRQDLYRFMDYTREHEIPTIWAHPLYHYKVNGIPPLEFFDQMALVFERFEVINGQRDTWQNMLVKNWIEALTPERISDISRKRGIKPDRFCSHPYRKSMSGGSDCHMGLFAGQTGTRLYIPDLQEKLKILSRSKIALEALKEGRMAPFGTPANSEKITISLLDYFCQIGINMKDPGLVRMALHKGTSREKLLALTLVNGFGELRRHKLTMNFLNTFHGCFTGEIPGLGQRLLVSKPYKGVFREASAMAQCRRALTPEISIQETFDTSINTIYTELTQLLVKRITEKAKKHEITIPDTITFQEIIEKLEIPSQVRNLFNGMPARGKSSMSRINISKLLDGLSFPFLASSVILGAHFTGTHVMYKSRELLNTFASKTGYRKHPERMLWLTDTLEDTNGVSTVLRSMLDEIRKRDLPIDILVASSTLESGDHLIVIPPLAEFTLPFYPEQPVRIPDIMTIHRIFHKGEYDRVMASTEGAMGLAALYLKEAYTVPAYFYVHTDWMIFARETLNLEGGNLSRFRRLLRAFYHGFDRLFVLNREQQKWLASEDMAIPSSRISLTAHWADSIFRPVKSKSPTLPDIRKGGPVILFAGRLSEEKGVKDLPGIYERVRASVPDARMVFAGHGPMESWLKENMPEALFLGWVDHNKLPEVYSAADILVLPSRFDTFGCVVLEALSTGLPVAAYKSKGPADILEHNKCGFLCKGPADMASAIIRYLKNPALTLSFKNAALTRAKLYSADTILENLMRDTGLGNDESNTAERRRLA